MAGAPAGGRIPPHHRVPAEWRPVRGVLGPRSGASAPGRAADHLSGPARAADHPGIISRWAPGHENNTGAYVAHVVALTGSGPDAVLDLQGYQHLASLVKAVITHENGRNAYPQSVVDDGLLRAGVQPPSRTVVSRAADRAKTTVAVAAGGAAVLSAALDGVQQLAPALPVVQQITTLPPAALVVVGLVAAAGLIARLVLRNL